MTVRTRFLKCMLHKGLFIRKKEDTAHTWHFSPLPKLIYTLIINILLIVTIGVVYASNGGGNTLDFDGSDDYLDCGSGANLTGMTDLTIEAWVKSDVAESDRLPVSNINQGGYQLHIASTSKFGNLFRDDTNTDRNIDATTSVTSGDWYHLAGTFDWNGSGTTLKIYVNGIEENSQYFAGSDINYNSVSPLYIGTNIDGVPPGGGPVATREWDGVIDEVRIWNTALSQSTIQDWMFRQLTSNHPNVTSDGSNNLVVYYPLNETSGSTIAYDYADDISSATANDCTLTNMDSAADWVSSTAPIGNLTTHKNGIAALWSSQTSTASDGIATGLDIADVSFLNATGDDVVFGHNNAAFANVITNLPAGVDKRWDRVWELIVTDLGTTGGNVDLTFDISDAGGQGNFSGSGIYYLLKRAAGSSADFTTVPVVNTSVSGDQLTFRVDVSNLGSEFTIGAPSGSPTAITLQGFRAWSATGTYTGTLLLGIVALVIGALALVRYRRHTQVQI